MVSLRRVTLPRKSPDMQPDLSMWEARGVEGVKTSSLLGPSMVEISARGGCINISKGENSTGFILKKAFLPKTVLPEVFIRGVYLPLTIWINLRRLHTENIEITCLPRYLHGSTPARKLIKFGLAKRPGV